MHCAHTETFCYKPEIGRCATPTAAAWHLCLAQGYLIGNSTSCSFHKTSFSSNVATTECRRDLVAGRVGVSWYSTSLTKWIAPLGCTLEKVWGCVRCKVWLGLVNRHPLYWVFAAALHISMYVWLAPSWRSIGELTVCKSWLYIKKADLKKRYLKPIAMGWI